MQNLIITLIAISSVLNISCVPPQNKNESSILMTVDRIIDADNKGQLEIVLSLYSDNAILMPPGRENIKGLPAIRDNYTSIFNNQILELSWQKDELMVGKNWAVLRGKTMGISISKTTNDTITIDDRFFMVLEKTNEGYWKIDRLMWN